MGLKQRLYDLLVSLSLDNWLSELIVSIAVIIIWIFIAIIVIKLMKRVTYRVFKVDKRSPRTLTIAKLSNSVFRYIVWFSIVMVILSELEVDLTPFIASAGILGLMLGFGAQEIVRDFMTGFFIMFEGSFDVGDMVEIDGFKGNVTSLGLRTTKIRNWLGEVKMINNGNIKSLINFSRNDSLAVVDFQVAYETDLEELVKLMVPFVEQMFEKYEKIIEKPEFKGVKGLGNSGIDMILTAKTKANEHFQVQRDLRREIVGYLKANDVEIPYPHMVVLNGES